MDNNVISITTGIQRNEKKFLANRVGDEMVMMDMETGDFLVVNNVAADIWALCENQTFVSNIISHLVQSYEITEEQCCNETFEFLRSGTEKKMFFVHNDDDLANDF